MFQFGEGGVGLYDQGCVEVDVEFRGEVGDALCFAFAAAVGEEDEGDSFALQVLEGFGGAGERGGGTEEDAVDAGIEGFCEQIAGEEGGGWCAYSNAKAKSGTPMLPVVAGVW